MQVPDDRLGVMLGLVLMLQAWVAPWLVVGTTAEAGTDEPRPRHHTAARERHEREAAAGLAAARVSLARAERLVLDAAASHNDTAPSSWSYTLSQLSDAVAEAEVRYDTLAPGPGDVGREDVDLAG